jgi:hypothetical protein
LRRLTQSTFNNITSFYARRYTRRELLFSSVVTVRVAVIESTKYSFLTIFRNRVDRVRSRSIDQKTELADPFFDKQKFRMIEIAFKTKAYESQPVDELNLKSETKGFKKRSSDTVDAS